LVLFAGHKNSAPVPLDKALLNARQRVVQTPITATSE